MVKCAFRLIRALHYCTVRCGLLGVFVSPAPLIYTSRQKQKKLSPFMNVSAAQEPHPGPKPHITGIDPNPPVIRLANR
jgi:hypothetical protein